METLWDVFLKKCGLIKISRLKGDFICISDEGVGERNLKLQMVRNALSFGISCNFKEQLVISNGRDESIFISPIEENGILGIEYVIYANDTNECLYNHLSSSGDSLGNPVTLNGSSHSEKYKWFHEGIEDK